MLMLGSEQRIPRLHVPLHLLPARGFLFRFFGGLYVDTGQGTAQRLDNAAESPLGHALPRHIP